MNKEELRLLLSQMSAETVALLIDNALSDDADQILWENDKERLAYWTLVAMVKKYEGNTISSS